MHFTGLNGVFPLIMGTIRLALALAVVLAHTHEPTILPLVASNVAVQVFFIISGFYMAVILNEKYTGPDSYRLFISNRFLRLYPVYFIVLAGTILICLSFGFFTGDALGLQTWKNYARSTDTLGLWFVGLTHLTIIGQDVVVFLGRASDGAFYFTSNFAQSASPQVHQFLVIPQAWAMSLELCFYLLAPFLVRRHLGVIALIVGLCFALKIVLFQVYHLHNDPWTYRFFPTELGLFLIGSCAYRAYEMFKSRLPKNKFAVGAWLALLASTLLYRALPAMETHGYSLRKTGYMVLAIVALPFAFQCSKHWKLDRMLGELSYPLYICHMAVIWVTKYVMSATPASDGLLTFFVLFFSLAWAYGLVIWVMQPVERFRQKRFIRHYAESDANKSLNAAA